MHNNNNVHLSCAHQRPEHSQCHIVHINLNMMFYTHAEHKNCIKYFMETRTRTHTHTAMNSNVHDTDQYQTSYMHMRRHTHSLTDCSRNCVLILVGASELCGWILHSGNNCSMLQAWALALSMRQPASNGHAHRFLP